MDNLEAFENRAKKAEDEISKLKNRIKNLSENRMINHDNDEEKLELLNQLKTLRIQFGEASYLYEKQSEELKKVKENQSQLENENQKLKYRIKILLRSLNEEEEKNNNNN
eukprot:TRINITY_DN53206_c0_g1_i1.p1 TRINITY_DN53206_c0_g1~~TRINITY_DN53206_c0_g1_i1.p1  ORF type:complete len:110 (+),score=37.23 TRINITY_DN53206_c0_g1_i1:28-357(+)